MDVAFGVRGLASLKDPILGSAGTDLAEKFGFFCDCQDRATRPEIPWSLSFSSSERLSLVVFVAMGAMRAAEDFSGGAWSSDSEEVSDEAPPEAVLAEGADARFVVAGVVGFDALAEAAVALGEDEGVSEDESDSDSLVELVPVLRGSIGTCLALPFSVLEA